MAVIPPAHRTPNIRSTYFLLPIRGAFPLLLTLSWWDLPQPTCKMKVTAKFMLHPTLCVLRHNCGCSTTQVQYQSKVYFSFLAALPPSAVACYSEPSRTTQNSASAWRGGRAVGRSGGGRADGRPGGRAGLKKKPACLEVFNSLYPELVMIAWTSTW